MKKTVMLFIVLVIALSITTSAFGQDDETIVIYPWQIPINEHGERVITVSPSQTVILGARWGACTRGLAHSWAKTAMVAYSINGQLIVTSDESQQYWGLPPETVPIQGESACINKSEKAWVVYWEYDLGPLGYGDHQVNFKYWNDRLRIDGGDYDGDGRPDFFDFDLEIDFIIRIVE